MPLDQFYTSKVNRGGFLPCCKKCKRLRQLRSNAKDPERIKQRAAAYRQDHRAAIKNNRAVYLTANREALRLKSREHRQLRRAAMTPEELKEFRRKRLESKRIHRAKKYGSGGRHSEKQWQELLRVCDYRCVCCGTSERLTRDHIVPLSRGGSDDIRNIQPLCRPCNSSKNKFKIIDYRTGAQIISVADLVRPKVCKGYQNEFLTINGKKLFCDRSCSLKFWNRRTNLKKSVRRAGIRTLKQVSTGSVQ